MHYDQQLFSELRLVSVDPDTAPLTEENLVRAMTANEELLQIGYTLSPKDIVTLAKSADIADFAARVREYAGDVKAQPMYPDFPSQVMDMDEAVFRFHQMLHYLSTYGIEELTGVKVTRGWLPEMNSTEKTEPDTRLLEAKTLALIGSGDRYLLPYQKILGITERMTDKECMMIAECLRHLPAEALTEVRVTFKQNLLLIFYAIFANAELSAEHKLNALHAICQHTGDVWKCMDYALTRARYHFRTSQKRLIVKLLESYPPADFRSNLILSNKKAARTILMLKFIDFNEYARREACKKAVADLRAGKLHSWEGELKALIVRRAPEALDIYAERPGMMLRQMTYLMRNGYSAQDIFAKLSPHAAEMKTQTLVSLCSFFAAQLEKSDLSDERLQEARILSVMMPCLLEQRLAANETALRGKRVCVQMPEYDLERSSLRMTDRSAEGGYIRSGLAYRIPENVRCIRFFIYWNDKYPVDIDLHASGTELNGSKIHIGWNADYKAGTICFSGDITHSDAAEYIDIDLVQGRASVSSVDITINLYSGCQTFGEIDECFVGAMAVDKTGTEIKLYNPQNCFFTHDLTGDYRTINYGYIDVQNRVIVFDGVQNKAGEYYGSANRNNAFHLRRYLDILFRSQGAEEVSEAEEADTVLVMGKPAAENEISLIDNNLFME